MVVSRNIIPNYILEYDAVYRNLLDKESNYRLIMNVYDYLYFALALIAIAIPIGAGLSVIKDWWVG